MQCRAGLIGAGRIGQIHADIDRRNEGIELAALAGVDPDLLDETASNESPSRAVAELVEALVAVFVSYDTQSQIALPLSSRPRSTEIRSQ